MLNTTWYLIFILHKFQEWKCRWNFLKLTHFKNLFWHNLFHYRVLEEKCLCQGFGYIFIIMFFIVMSLGLKKFDLWIEMGRMNLPFSSVMKKNYSSQKRICGIWINLDVNLTVHFYYYANWSFWSKFINNIRVHL